MFDDIFQLLSNANIGGIDTVISMVYPASEASHTRHDTSDYGPTNHASLTNIADAMHHQMVGEGVVWHASLDFSTHVEGQAVLPETQLVAYLHTDLMHHDEIALQHAHPFVEHQVTHDPVASTHSPWVGDMGGQFIPHRAYWAPYEFHGEGHPLEYSHYWQQQTGEDCAVMAQGEIFESLTGYHLSEHDLCQFAQEHGLYDPETGTNLQDVGKLLNMLGVQTEERQNANLATLADALQHNDRVIAVLNANEIWYSCRDSATGMPLELANAGHAVWVTGIDQAPDGSIKVILCDSGIPNGQMEAVDAEDFLNAWSDYGDEMIIAHSPM